MHRRVRTEALDRLLTEPAATTWTREFLQPRQEATYMRRSRALVASALLPVLSDDGIAEHLDRVVNAAELKKRTVYETSQSEIHLDLLQRHYHAMPREGAVRVAKLLTQVFADDSLASQRRSKWAWLPLWDWTKSGSIDPRGSEVQNLVEALVAFYGGAAKPDGFANSGALQLLDELRSAGAITLAHLDSLAAALDRAILSGLEADGEASEVLQLVRARQELQESDGCVSHGTT